MSRKIISIILFIAIIFSLAGCGGSTTSNSYAVYFKNSENNALVAETRSVKDKMTLEESATFVIEELIKGPEGENNIAVFPKGTKLLNLSIDASTVTVDFSGAFYNQDGVDELLCRLSIVRTLCEIKGITRIEILVDGEAAVSKTTQRPVGILGVDDIIYDTITSNSEKVSVKLYFQDENAEYLVAETREIDSQSALSIEKAIVTQLIEGPKLKNSVRTIPQETKLISAETKDKICFVNFSSDFVNKHSGGSSADIMTIYSIVNSLTELDGVDSVQFLVEGNTDVEFGNFVLDEVFTRNESLIKR